MAQLRDGKTSEILFEGTPLEVVLIADEIGREEVLFDDVGEAFNPDAVIGAHRDSLAAMDAAAKNTKIDKETKDQTRESAKRERAKEADTKKKVANVQKALKAARDR